MTNLNEDELTPTVPAEGEATTDAFVGADDDDDAPRVERGPIPLLGIDPQTIALGINSFDDLPLSDVIRESVAKVGWTSPTPVQKLCLPYSLRGRDVAGFAQTGTGKTGVFLLTVMSKILADRPADAPPAAEGDPARPLRCVVLAPTRELAMQIEQDAEPMFEHVGLASIAVFGGIDYDKQARKLKEGVDVIFATPGRLMDYVKKGWVNLKTVDLFVCDEADRMFDMGFIEDVEFFLERIPETAQKLLFSATTNDQVKELAFEYLETPEYISINPEQITPERIEQHAIHVHAKDKLKVMLGLLRDHNPTCSVIFTNTKLTAEWLHFKLSNNGIDADLITGDLPQKKRISLIHRIKEGKVKALIATDVASRGLHISSVTHVYNFDLPDESANYVHRIGRTARAGARGSAFSLVCDDYGQNLAGINDLLGETLAMKSEWFEDSYLQIKDNSGNPFEGRMRGAERSDRPSHGPRDFGDRPDRGPRDFGDRPDRGPRDFGDHPDRGPRPSGDRPDRGPRPDRGDRPDRGPRPNSDQNRPPRTGASRDVVNGQNAGGTEGEGGKKRRRRRGKGKGEGHDGQQDQQGHNAGGQQGRQQGGGQQQGGRGREQQRGGGRNASGYQGTSNALAPAKGGFLSMIKRIFATIFGRKK